MDLRKEVIETDRLILKATTLEDVPFIFEQFTVDLTQYMFPVPSGKIEDTKAFVEASLVGLEAGNNLQLSVFDKENHAFLGCCGLHKLNDTMPEVGIWLSKTAHGHHYGLEIVSALIEWAKMNTEVSMVKYPVDHRNIPSQKIPLALGGVTLGHLKLINMANFELEIVEYGIKVTR